MSGPYGPNDAPGPGEGRNDPTQQWGGQQTPGGASPSPWGGQSQTPQTAPPTQQWDQSQPPQPQWGQQPSQPNQPQWGQQPSQPNQPQWGQQPSQPNQPQWGQQPAQPGPQDWGQQPQQPPQQDWGQQGQQPQWGQQGQQPQWGQAQQIPTQSGGKGKGLIIGLGVGALLVVGAIIALVLVLTSKDELDNTAVQDGVKKVLSDSYGIQDVADVSCPSGQKVEVDATFTCSLKVSGEQKKVTVKITKDDGTYEVGRPN
ncbi:DUF4333 domain-containing protein [Nocardia sp. NPDC057440]|uniref:DUF4333 domain-containing protein n=1 Tax=Nocardia sp. NPDC057440 TaxID=3346134 RepID=UPI00366BF596